MDGSYCVQVAEVDIANLDAALGQNAREQPIAAAVQIVAGDNFIARRQQPRDRGDGRQSGAEAKAACTVLQRAICFSTTARVGLPLRE